MRVSRVKPASSKPPGVVIVTPALADANNGNWQTAQRWQQWLAPHGPVRLVKQWPDALASTSNDAVMLALHARRSAESIAAWAAKKEVEKDAPGLAVVLTGTDLYRDIRADAAANQSLALARQLVVLQTQGVNDLPEQFRAKTRVIFQSTTMRPAVPKINTQLRALMVGHLRAEKSPQTLFDAARLLAGEEGLFIDHIGEALDSALGQLASATQAACPHYRWLGGVPHEATRRHIQRAHVLVITSQMEGGAHVIMEAVCSGTPVLASRVPGNVGMLGADYAGYFEPGDAAGLAALLKRCQQSQLDGLNTAQAKDDKESSENQAAGWLDELQSQCAQRAPLFSPEAEQAALLALVRDLLN
jgi:putative glycosyltransferase (TIGR04348 family)